ncbi:hypothetical protein BDQ17DRAFT_1345436 [Cyathus striatus]|nr:hypothetical protein BDQ17DRAFT_1345436 [Cyathus striatus]
MLRPASHGSAMLRVKGLDKGGYIDSILFRVVLGMSTTGFMMNFKNRLVLKTITWLTNLHILCLILSCYTYLCFLQIANRSYISRYCCVSRGSTSDTY